MKLWFTLWIAGLGCGGALPAPDQRSAARLSQAQNEFRSSDGVTLRGTLRVPHRPLGAVLLIGGSGKTDRDETVPGKLTASGKTERLFLQITKRLAAADVATLCYDKRGVLGDHGEIDTGIWATADREHLIADAMAAAHELLKSTGLSPQQLLILGHSEGTIVAVETALRFEADSGAALGGVLLLGAQARPMEEMLRFQIASSDTSQTPAQVDLATKEALALIASTSEVFAPDGKPIAWYRQFLAAPANEHRLPLVRAKVALFQGEADVQTPSEEVERFLRFRTQRINVHKYKGLGHGFSQPKDGRPTLGPIAQSVLDDIANEALGMLR
jgi:pimeloyl-ACP methyl ester carboxylesterase